MEKKKKHSGELKSVTHAFHPRGPGGTCPGWHEPSAQETDPPTEVWQTKERQAWMIRWATASMLKQRFFKTGVKQKP